MAVLNQLLGRLFDLLLKPLESFPPIVGLAALALLTAVPMLLVFRAASDQRRIQAIKRAMVGALFEIRLFNDDLSAVFRAQAELLRHNAAYLRMSLVPMLWLAVPLGLTVAHLEYRFGYAGPAPGQRVLVKAQLREGKGVSLGDGLEPGPAKASATLVAPAPVHVLTPAVWFPATGEILWQISADAPGEYELQLHVGSEVAVKTFRVAGGIARRSPVRSERAFASQLAYPAEPPLLEGSSLSSIRVAYEPATIPVLGWQIPWIVAYFVLTILFAIPLRKPLGVTL